MKVSWDLRQAHNELQSHSKQPKIEKWRHLNSADVFTVHSNSLKILRLIIKIYLMSAQLFLASEANTLLNKPPNSRTVVDMFCG